MLQTFNKEIKNAPECIVELYKHAGIFKNTREVHREARGAAECFSHFSSVLVMIKDYESSFDSVTLIYIPYIIPLADFQLLSFAKINIFL